MSPCRARPTLHVCFGGLPTLVLSLAITAGCSKGSPDESKPARGSGPKAISASDSPAIGAGTGDGSTAASSHSTIPRQALQKRVTPPKQRPLQSLRVHQRHEGNYTLAEIHLPNGAVQFLWRRKSTVRGMWQLTHEGRPTLPSPANLRTDFLMSWLSFWPLLPVPGGTFDVWVKDRLLYLDDTAVAVDVAGMKEEAAAKLLAGAPPSVRILRARRITAALLRYLERPTVGSVALDFQGFRQKPESFERLAPHAKKIRGVRLSILGTSNQLYLEQALYHLRHLGELQQLQLQTGRTSHDWMRNVPMCLGKGAYYLSRFPKLRSLIVGDGAGNLRSLPVGSLKSLEELWVEEPEFGTSSRTCDPGEARQVVQAHRSKERTHSLHEVHNSKGECVGGWIEPAAESQALEQFSSNDVCDRSTRGLPNLKNLKTLSLSDGYERFTGYAFKTIAQLASLRALRLSSTYFEASRGERLEYLKGLRWLELSTDATRGFGIGPKTLGALYSLPNLEVLSLMGNQRAKDLLLEGKDGRFSKLRSFATNAGSKEPLPLSWFPSLVKVITPWADVDLGAAPGKGLRHLKQLQAREIRNGWGNLGAMGQLTSLSLRSIDTANLPALSKLESLRTLGLRSLHLTGGNSVYLPIRSLRVLEVGHLSAGAVERLARASQLRHLSFTWPRSRPSLDWLRRLRQLRTVRIVTEASETLCTDFQKLKGLKGAPFGLDIVLDGDFDSQRLRHQLHLSDYDDDRGTEAQAVEKLRRCVASTFPRARVSFYWAEKGSGSVYSRFIRWQVPSSRPETSP